MKLGEDEAPAAPALEGERRKPTSEAARKRAAVELIARHEASLRRTARRYSFCADDAEDAFQRGLEILLTKAPTEDLRELVRWTHTVIKHEALTVRRNRERLLGPTASAGEDGEEHDWLELVATDADGPPERAERHEEIARSREALQALKPQELRALTLLAEGYSYAEISRITGFSNTKVNRCLAEGRERFRSLISRSEDGTRCEEMKPLLSAFCDDETSREEAAVLHEHLRACAHCRATLRAYRAAPRAAAALAPLLPASESLLERAHAALAGLASRLPGGGADSAVSGMAASGGTRGAGMAALAKVLAVCVGTAGGAAACVATGVVPAPLELAGDRAKAPTVERRLSIPDSATASAIEYEPAPEPEPPAAEPQPKPEPAPAPTAEPEPVSTGAVEYEAAAAPAAEPAAAPASSSSGSAAGEFGP